MRSPYPIPTRRAAALRTIALATALVAGALCVTPAAAERPVATDPVPVPELFAEDITCRNATEIAQQFVPYFMVWDEPDSLLATLDWWQTNCGSCEPIRRTRMLAAIWDDAFTEEMYDTRVIDDLAWRYSEDRLEAQRTRRYSNIGWGNVASLVDFTPGAADYDAFTEDVADQLLPHVVPDSVEEFLCLFYSGRPDTAFALLRDGVLEGTELHERYFAEMEAIDVPAYRDFWGVSWGWRRAMGDLGDLGNQQTLSVFAGRRWTRWSIDLGLGVRLGRADEPYYVRDGGFYGFSDRYAGVNLAVDVGYALARFGPVYWDAVIGGAIEALNPFQNEEDLVLTMAHGSLGTALRYEPRSDPRWFAAADWRRTWISDPPEEGTDLGGHAWSVRLALGFYLQHGEQKKLNALGGPR